MNISMNGIFDGSLLDSRFANRLLTDKRTLRIGNIVSFLGPVGIGRTVSEQSMNFCFEVPDVNAYAGVCLTRLFLHNVAGLVSEAIDCPVEVDGHDIVVKSEHTHQGIVQKDGIVSSVVRRKLPEAYVAHVGLYNIAGEGSIPRAYSLGFDNDRAMRFMDRVNESFYVLVNGVFLETSRL